MAEYPTWLPADRVYHSGAFSDMTIICADEKFQVHKVVVCSQSSFFNTVCSKPWGKSTQPAVDLSDDDVETVKRMIDFFYRGDYQDFESDKFTQHAQVFAIATKYDIDKLAQKAAHKFWNANIKCWDAEAFLKSVPIVYLGTPEQVLGLRDVATRCIRVHFTQLGGDADIQALWRETCTSNPTFAFHLLQSFHSSPFMAHCHKCGYGQAMEVNQFQCLKCRGWKTSKKEVK
ncbi:hypothetical protein AYO21_03885 [Fonsecaea monophora]|uniref:BTB domain-containing protein n=1 Tax=Fonsecaea monophora TaxID=254056 RepID=A0A177FEK8_9EURO|nr:hypothetical protein AYO21_03885 [Fonsecaea monophora]OAG41882.1 hypothetical protein AYO21_03885 [Fonsecaea monophora]